MKDVKKSGLARYSNNMPFSYVMYYYVSILSSFCVLLGYKLIFYLYVTIVKNCNESAVNNLLNFKIWQKLTSSTVRHPQVSHKNSEKLDRIYYF